MMKSLFPDSAALHPGYRGWFSGGQGLEAGFYRCLVKTLDADKNLLAGSIMTLPAFNFYPLVFFEVLVVLVEMRDLLQQVLREIISVLHIPVKAGHLIQWYRDDFRVRARVRRYSRLYQIFMPLYVYRH